METNLIETRQNMPKLFSADPAAIAAAETAKVRVQAAYIVAMERPRNEDQARDRILHACKRPAFAERVEFNKPIAGRQIKGPSIRFAELALREWQNILTETQVLYEDDFIRRIKVIVTDLETNASHSKEIQINKTIERKKTEGREVLRERINSYGKKVFLIKATEDELYNKEAALISKALRNEGLRLIPSDVTDEGIEVARQTLRNRDAQDPDSAKKKLLDAFSSIGVRPKDLEQYLKHKTDALTPAELQDLRGIYRAIKDGELTWTDYVFEKPTTKEPKVTKETYTPTKIPKNEKSKEKVIDENALSARVTLPVIASFSKLNKIPFQNFEKVHRNEIAKWPSDIFEVFCEKWESKMKQSYETFLRQQSLINNEVKLPEEPQQESAPVKEPSGGLGIVKCPETNEAVTLTYCKMAKCVPFKEKSCLARFPVDERPLE